MDAPQSQLEALAAEIDRRLQQDEPAPPLDSATLQQLTQLLDELNRFVDFLHQRYFGATPPPAASGIKGKGLLQTIQQILARALTHPESLAKHYAAFAGEVLRALRQESDLTPDEHDRRFRDEAWRTIPFYRSLLQIYLAWSRTMQSWVDAQDFDERDRQRVRFVFDQLIAALAPSNLPLNPAALKRAEASEGASVVAGVKQWIDDVLHNHAMPLQIRPDAYEVGRDLAITPGAVVYRNAQLELIQYAPRTECVFRRPLLLLPPQINKYYVFDLKPANSILGYLVQQGFQVFAISWRNPTAAERDWGLDTYVAATLQAIEVMREITSSAAVGLISGCAGALTALALLGYLAETGRPLVRSHSLLVTSVQANTGSALELFATPQAIENARAWARVHGTLDGRALAHVFCWLRPNELVWNYWVNDYLMGRKPPPLDVIYWDNDPTRLPARVHGDFLDMFVNEVFEKPRALEVLGTRIDFRNVRVDTYFAGGRDDYLMPWEGVYAAAKLFRGRHTFMLSTSGHVQSMLRPPSLPRTEYFTNPKLPRTPAQWLAGAQRHEGSWWPHWSQWLARQSGPVKAAPKRVGNARYRPLVPAPGSYVHERM